MDLQKGDVVRLSPFITREEFDVDLRDGWNELIELDGEVLETRDHMCRVLIRRMLQVSRILAPEAHAVTRWVLNEHIVGVVEGKATLWPLVGGIRAAATERDRSRRALPPPSYWEAG